MSKGDDGGRAGRGSGRGGRAAGKGGKAQSIADLKAMLDNRSRQLNPVDDTYKSSRGGTEEDEPEDDD